MAYVDEVIKEVSEKNSNEPEFIQAVTEVLESLRVVIEANEEEYKKNALLERLLPMLKTVEQRQSGRWHDHSDNAPPGLCRISP